MKIDRVPFVDLGRQFSQLEQQKGDFPAAESLAATTLSLPVHEFITTEQLDQMIAVIQKFYED